jgi:hypothetical protein
MRSIQDFTQSRLSILLYDKTTNTLLRNFPVYAEVSLRGELPPYTIQQQPDFAEAQTPLRKWFASHASVFQSIKEVIVGNVSESDFNAIADKNQLFLAILEKIKANMADGDTEEAQQQLISKIVLQALQRLKIPVSLQPKTETLLSHPLGTLASDHAGYISYDLTGALARFRGTARDGKLVKPEISFFVYPRGQEVLKIDALQQARFTPDVIFGKLQVERPDDFDGRQKVNLPSMHNPGLEDWYLSPGSFALNPAFFVGADGCENLYPANFATHEFNFFQVIRGKTVLIEPATNDDKKGHIDIVLEVRAGWSLEYLVSWQPLGHTVGQLVYSLPLAPGEIVKIAVLDWSRKSIDSKNEDLAVKEQLVHNTHRDRNVSETVDAAMQEWQRGGSFMGGVAGSYGGAGYGISGALGGGYSTSSGDRNIHASTVQQISDAFAQASSSVRELRSTIVVQSDQQERAAAETRVVANHNHSHALTMLYYEVLRHYKVSTQFMRVRPSILVQYGHIDFRSPVNIIRHRKILESVLIEPRYIGCFDAVQKLLCLKIEFERKKAQLALQPNPNDSNELGEIRLIVKTSKAADRVVFSSIVTKNREEVICQLVSPQWDPGSLNVVQGMLPDRVDDQDPNTIMSPLNYRQDGQSNVFVVKPYKTVLWADVDGVMLRVGPSAHAWDIESMQVIAASGAKTWIIVDQKLPVSVPANGQKFLPSSPYKEIPADPADLLTEEERCCIEKLTNHLADNTFHYKKAIWLQEDPNERASRFKTMIATDKTVLPAGKSALLDMIDNRPIDVLGDYVVFPSRRFHEVNEELNALDRVQVEKLMSLPTRGVFAEARLGHCNASEEIDNTRFWDWQTSPITEQAPGIDNLNLNNSRNAAANLTSTPFPSSIVNIVTPQALPDPTGMAGAMTLLGKGDVFRDMSVSKEVEDLLEKLADKSVSIGEAAEKAKDIQQQREKNANAPAAPAAPQKNVSPAEAQQQIKISENQANKGTITPDEHKDNVKKSIEGMSGGNKGTDVTVTINFKHSISGPLDGEFGIEFIGPVGGSFFTKTAGGVGAGKVTILTGSEYTIQIRGKRTRLPVSLDTIAQIPDTPGNPAFSLDVSNHITKREVPIEANVVATITKGRKTINITVVAEEVAKDVKVSAKVTSSGTLKADLEGELGLKLVGVDVGHVKAGAAVETTVGGEVTVELPIEFKRLTGNVTVPKNELVL